MRRFLFIVLAAVMLGGCTQVEDDEEENKDFDDGTIENINAVLTVINTYDDGRELYVYYCKTKEDTTLYYSETIGAGATVQIPLTQNKVKISYRTNTYKDFEGSHNSYTHIWGFVNGDFTITLGNLEISETFDMVCMSN